MTRDVLVETTIHRTPEVVSSYAGNPSNATSGTPTSGRSPGKHRRPSPSGSLMEFEAHFIGRRLVYTYEIAELVPRRLLIMRTADGPFPMETTYSWERSDEGTRMTLRNRGEPSGFARVAAPVIERAMRRATSRDLARLKAILERTGGPGTREA